MERDNERPPTETPRWLLHVPSMTSVTWEEALVQCEGSTPAYNVLSYTWGRFVTSGPALQVCNTTWTIPAIRKDHFGVTEFEKVLYSIASPQGYVWVDIACIDQEDHRVKMDEIGKQADIFRGAKAAFIWLTRLDEATLRNAIACIENFEDKIMATDMDRASFSRNHQQVHSILDSSVQACINAAEEVLFDPWFSSLWALQEANLREDATILARSGSQVACGTTRRSSHDLDLSWISGTLQGIMMGLINFRSPSEPVQRFIHLIERSGLLTINAYNEVPLHIYPAAHYRTCENEPDRVYAIMQVYRLRLGSSKYPGKIFTLDQLELQLAKSLNALSPMAAQLFIHQHRPKRGQAWKVTRRCTLPTIYYIAECTSKQSAISSSSNDQGALFTGACSKLSQLIGFWTASMLQRERQRTEERWSKYAASMFSHYQVNIDLDAGHAGDDAVLNFWRLANEPSKLCFCTWCQMHSTRDSVSGLEMLAQKLPEPVARYYVLCLGRTTLYQWTPPSIKVNDVQAGLTVNAWLGMLGLMEQSESGPRFTRVGLCSWEAGQEDLKDQHETIWQHGSWELL